MGTSLKTIYINDVKMSNPQRDTCFEHPYIAPTNLLALTNKTHTFYRCALGLNGDGSFCNIFMLVQWIYFGSPAVWSYPKKMAYLVSSFGCCKDLPVERNMKIYIIIKYSCWMYTKEKGSELLFLKKQIINGKYIRQRIYMLNI